VALYKTGYIGKNFYSAVPQTHRVTAHNEPPMIRTMSQLLEEGSSEEILSALKTALKRADEAPFWEQKVVPFAETVLSVLVPLREQKLLFTPEGKPEEKLTAELFLRWCDLANLKWLAFTLQSSNHSKRLMRTRYEKGACERYAEMDLERLGHYLSSYMVNLENEMYDFPSTHYNLHIGIADVIKKLL
jgi:hypothetical protein